MKYVWRCPNIACKWHAAPYIPGQFEMKYDKAARSMVPTLPAGEERCPACGSLLQAEAVQNEIPEFSVGTFGGKTDKEKKAILKQRYDAGMKTGGKDEVEMRRRTAIAKMIGYDK